MKADKMESYYFPGRIDFSLNVAASVSASLSAPDVACIINSVIKVKIRLENPMNFLN